MEIFDGFKTFIGETAPQSAVKNAATKKTSASSDSQTHVFVCTKSHQVDENLDISSSVSVKYDGLTVDAKANYVHELAMTELSTVLLIRKTFFTTETKDGDIAIKDHFPFLTRDAILKFYNEHGDSYVSEISMGKEFIGTFHFRSNTLREKNALEVELSAKYDSGAGFGASADLASSFSKTVQDSKTTCEINFVALGVGDIDTSPKNPLDPASIIEKMMQVLSDFSNMKPTNPVMVNFKPTPYQDLFESQHSKNAFKPITDNLRNFVDRDALTPGYLSKQKRLEALLNQCLAIKEYYRYYSVDSTTAFIDNLLEANCAKIKDQFDAVSKMLIQLADNPLSSINFPDAELGTIFKWGTPELNFQIVDPLTKDQMWGGGGDGAFNYEDVTNDSIVAMCHLDLVEIFPDYHHFGRIRLTYSQNSIKYKDTVSRITLSPLVHGKNGASPTTISLQAGNSNKFITKLEGWTTKESFAANVSCLELTINFQPNPTIIGGHRDGSHGIWEWTRGEALVGFKGYAGDSLDSLHPQILKFGNASWPGAVS